MKTNKSVKGTLSDRVMDKSTRLAGGYGVFAAKQGADALLRRAVMACLLWENVAYESGSQVANNIKSLIPQVEPETVAQIAVEARTQQKLRHVPLFIAREMARLDTHKHLVGSLLPKIILRADELTEFLAIYFKDGKDQPISKQVKIGLAEAFNRFNAYNLAKYNRDSEIKLRDVAFLTHVKPSGQGQTHDVPAVSRKGYKRGKVLRHSDSLIEKLIKSELPTPDTWEVALSAGKDKKETWERLISENKLGGLAFIRNLRNMEQAGVDPKVIARGFETVNAGWILPLNYLSAAKYAPKWERELETLMLKGLSNIPKLTGYTILVVDVSGSMSQSVSDKSEMTRLNAGAAMAMLASEMCERVSIYATAGSDGMRVHKTSIIKPRRGFALIEEIESLEHRLGGGGIFTRQCLEYIKQNERETPDRIIVFSDSQDCDITGKKIPAPFGKRNYIVDVSSHDHGVNYNGLWDAEISGWSEHFLTFIAALEGVGIHQEEE